MNTRYFEHHRHLYVSLVTAVAPHERHLAHKRHPSASPLPPVDAESSTALSPKVVDECEIQLPTLDDPNRAWQFHGSHPESTASAAPSPTQLLVPLENPPLDVADQDPPAVLSSYSRAASSALTALDDERSSAPSSPPRDGYPASGREVEASSPPSSATGAGTKRHPPTPSLESDPDVVSSISASAPPKHARSRTKRRRTTHMDSDDDMSLGDWKKLSRASASAQRQPPTLAPTHLPVPASPPRASCSSTPTSPVTAAAASPSSPAFDQNPHDTGANDDKNADENHDNDCHDDDDGDHQSCPHPALLGILVEAFALSRASSLPLSTLTHKPRPRRLPTYCDYVYARLGRPLTYSWMLAEAMAFVFSNTCIRKKAMSSRRPPPLMQHKEIPTSLLPSRVIPDSAPPPIPMVTISQTDPVNLPTPGSSSSSAYILRWTVVRTPTVHHDTRDISVHVWSSVPAEHTFEHTLDAVLSTHFAREMGLSRLSLGPVRVPVPAEAACQNEDVALQYGANPQTPTSSNTAPFLALGPYTCMRVHLRAAAPRHVTPHPLWNRKGAAEQ
ncbi:hypothetical protein BJV77DRAFT_965906 [Russula vinacea]|nr:hypothetical protein BJV77DRAFT_965906 [Russula vinacea]